MNESNAIMHIFSLDNKPYLIISSKDLLFRHNVLDEKMKRCAFNDIKKITIIHRYNASKELFVWIRIQTRTQHTPLFVQVSSLSEPLEEVLDVLRDELKGKIKLSLPKNSFMQTLRTRYKTHKTLTLMLAVLLLALLGYHKTVTPSLQLLKTNALQAKLEENKGFCSSRAKVAYNLHDSQTVKVNTYCALFGFWKLQTSKEVPLPYLETEFSSLSADDYLQSAHSKVQQQLHDAAIIDVNKALYLDPKNANAYTLLSQIQTQQGKYLMAVKSAEQAISLNPSSASAHRNIALLYQNHNNIEKASFHFQRSSELEPEASVYIALAQLQHEQGLWDESLQNYEKSLYLQGDNTYALTQVGNAYWAKKNFYKAKKSLHKAYLLEPSNAQHFLNYYQISLVTPPSISPKERDDFVAMHKDDPHAMLTYEMLKVLQLSIEDKPTEEAEQAWLESFKDTYLNWSFKEIRSWLDQSNLTLEHQQKVQATIGFFIGNQQAYRLQHQSTLPQEVYR